MNKELTLKERLHDLNYVLTNEEIEELADICGEHGNSWCPLVEFFNDIFFNENKDYNKNQAFKDLWLIALIVLDKEEELKAFEIIKKKFVIPAYIKNTENVEKYNKRLRKITFRKDYQKRALTKEEYDLLKEVLNNGD